MRPSATPAISTSVRVWRVGMIASCILLAGLTWHWARTTAPPAPDASRAEWRRQTLAVLRAADRTASSTYAILDPPRGIVRLPIDRAIELTIERWQDPAAARSNLLARLEKATAKPPEQPNPYE